MTTAARTFVAEMIENGNPRNCIFVRGAKLATELRVIELRTKKENWAAACVDDLGHWFVLDRRGNRKQVFATESKYKG